MDRPEDVVFVVVVVVVVVVVDNDKDSLTLGFVSFLFDHQPHEWTDVFFFGQESEQYFFRFKKVVFLIMASVGQRNCIDTVEVILSDYREISKHWWICIEYHNRL